jgi:mono/diheme cytochrome c family protein
MRSGLWTAAIAVLTVTASAACGGGGDAENAPAQTPEATTPAPAATTPAAGGEMQLPPGVTPEMVAQGDQIFRGAGTCTTCHGPDAKGTTLAPDLTDDQWLNVDGTYDAIVDLIKTGVPTPKEHPAPMQPRAGQPLTDEQVNAAAAYVYSIAHRGM